GRVALGVSMKGRRTGRSDCNARVAFTGVKEADVVNDVSTPALAPEAPRPESSRAQLLAFLDDCERRCGDGEILPARILNGQGYHTTLPNGTLVHSTRDAADYALALFAEGGADS